MRSGGEGSAACRKAGGKLEGFAGSRRSIAPTLKTRAGVGCRYSEQLRYGIDAHNLERGRGTRTLGQQFRAIGHVVH